MRGNIYSRQKCPVCNGKMVHDESRQGCYCIKHPEVAATKGFIIKFGRDIRKEVSTYDLAIRLLIGLRFKSDEGTLDPRDYLANNPMAFDKIASDYLWEKREKKSFRDINRMILSASRYFGDRNIKSISRKDVKDWLRTLNVSNKTKANYCAQLHNLFHDYCVEEEILTKVQVPEFPRIEYELGWRTITDWETQQKIMDALYAMIWNMSPKVYLGIDLLRTYMNIRPGDLLKLTEGDVDIKNGVLVFWYPTKKKNQRKTVRLLDEHIEMIATLKKQYPALPQVKFFRHTSTQGGIHINAPYGENIFYRRWKWACEKVGVKGLSLYGGTRHTTTTELAKLAGQNAAKEASGHDTNKAFDRYCQMQGERAHSMAALVRAKQTPSRPKKKITKMPRGGS